MRVVIVGRGRAGRSFARALEQVGVEVGLVAGRREAGGSGHVGSAEPDVVLLAVPDDQIAPTAATLGDVGAVVAHCSGSRSLDVLEPHPRVASIHPLMSLPDADTGADRLLDQCTFAVAGDPIVSDLVELLGGRAIEVSDDQRAVYHAAACVAANHLVVLAAQVERLSSAVGVPAEAYWTMMRTTLANVESAGAVASLTGPAARGDTGTIEAHVAALDPAERELYRTLADHAGRLARPER